MKPIYTLAVSLVFLTFALSAPSALSAPPGGSGEKKRLQLTIIRHQPCTAKPTPSERIRFPPSSKAPLNKDNQRGDGCYSISGPVTVHKLIRGTVQIYVEARTGSRSPIEKCTGADSSGCGGAGSCVYCDIGSSTEAAKKKTSGPVQLVSSGKSLDFENGVKAGNHPDMRISFCMPTKEEFLESEGLDEDTWNANKEGGRTFFMTMYVFNKAVNTLSTRELQKIARDDGAQVIGCHRLVGTVFDPND